MNEQEIRTAITTEIAKSTKLAVIKVRIEDAVERYNTARMEGKTKEMASIGIELDGSELEDGLIVSYAEECQSVVFTALSGMAADLLPAIILGSFPVVQYQDKREKNEDGIITVTRKVVEKERRIDLRRFDNYCTKKLKAEHKVHDTKAWSLIEEMNFYLAKKAAKEIGSDIGSNYAFSAGIVTGNFTEEDFASNTKMLASLQRVIDALIYSDPENGGKNQYRAITHDVAYLYRCALQKGRERLSMKAARHRDMTAYVSDVVYRIATKADYRVTYKEVKQK